MNDIPTITDAMREAAKKQPNSYLYVIDPAYAKDGPDGAVPPEGIVGAFPVNANGDIIAEFQFNPNYKKPDNSGRRPQA